MSESKLKVLRSNSPEADKTEGRPHAIANGVQAMGPYRDGRYLVNVGHAVYTPAQALRLATEIIECAIVASAAQRKAEQS